MEGLKNFPLFKFVYSIPGLAPFYHYLLSFWGAAFYGHPSKKIFVVGITGTKGKTTTVEILNAILEAAGKKTALISSLRAKIGGESEKNKTGNSMPGRFFLQRFLRRAANAGCTYAIVEVTSQGVVFSRHRFIDWNAAILTNLAPEHVEAHGTFENYRRAKLSFLKCVARRGGKVFLNKDDKYFDFFEKALADSGFTAYSKDDKEFVDVWPGISPVQGAVGIESHLLGEFSKENVAAAVAIAKHIGIEAKTIEGALRNFKGVPGRMEFVQARPFAVVIDYAHTVESLESAYRALRERMAQGGGKLISVLGSCGGKRDTWKRPAMGKVAAEYCDKVILTDEDPYDENPEEIISQIALGFSRVPGSSYRSLDYERIVDRREAIRKAISIASPGDTVVMTGKGSEDWIHVAKGKKIPWSEREVAEELLREIKNSHA
jgi:UDP-N-acetylmuramoyl-L-alanyl-D-glutamate--2,6-diaminopimelate ligase